MSTKTEKDISITETNDKVLRWCQALHKEGLLSEVDLDKCAGQFSQLNQAPKLGVDTIASNDDLKREYGMTNKQLLNATLDPIKYMLDNDQRRNIQITIEGIRIDPESSHLRTLNKLEAPTEFNLINRGSKIGCLLQDTNTGRYVGLKQKASYKGADYIAIADLVTPNPSSYFRLTSIGTNDSYNSTIDSDHHWEIEAMSQSGFGLTLLQAPINRVILSNLGSPNQYFQLIAVKQANNANKSNSNTDGSEFHAEEARARIDDILANINQHRLEYYKLLAMRDFLNGLREKMSYVVSSNGPVMDYYHQTISQLVKRDNEGRLVSNSDSKQRQLISIQSSIKTELEANELATIDSMILQLDKRAKAYSSGPLSSSVSKIDTLYASIDKAIKNRNDQIKQLDVVLKKVNQDQQAMTNDLQRLNKLQLADTHKTIISTTNDSIIKDQESTHKITYWGIIVLFVILLACIGIFGRQLWQRILSVKGLS